MNNLVKIVIFAASLICSMSPVSASETEGTIDTPDFKYTFKIEPKKPAAPTSTSSSAGSVDSDTVAVQICNKINQPVFTVTATQTDSLTNEFLFRGWFRIEPGSCRTFRGPGLGKKRVNFLYHAAAYENGSVSVWGKASASYTIPSSRFAFKISRELGVYPAGEYRDFDSVLLTPGVTQKINLSY